MRVPVTDQQVIDQCKAKNCDKAVNAFVNSYIMYFEGSDAIPQILREFAASMANTGKTSGLAKKNFVAGLREAAKTILSKDKALSDEIASVADSLEKDTGFQTDALQQVSAN